MLSGMWFGKWTEGYLIVAMVGTGLVIRVCYQSVSEGKSDQHCLEYKKII